MPQAPFSLSVVSKAVHLHSNPSLFKLHKPQLLSCASKLKIATTIKGVFTIATKIIRRVWMSVAFTLLPHVSEMIGS